MRLALAQINPLVGDLRGNAERLATRCQEAAGLGADLVVAPELALWGYPPRDLLLRPSLQRDQDQLLGELAEGMPPRLSLLLGVSDPLPGGQQPALFNAAALVQRGQWRIVARKRLLPSYDVFDERRYFRSADRPSLLELPVAGRLWRLGLTICEDLWVEETLPIPRLAGPDPIAELIPLAPELLINLSASPFGQGKPALRHQLAQAAVARLGCPVVYVNQVGGNDELVFDGASFVVDATGAVRLQLACAEEDLGLYDSLTATPDRAHQANTDKDLPAPIEQLFRVLVLGLRDYARKCGFQRALLGLSGGIDSALVAALAVAALGPDHVQALLMPSPYSSPGSISDALALADTLDLAHDTVAIEPLMEQFAASLEGPLTGPPRGLAAENLQSRIRGTLLMALANQQGQLLLSTGNKSELAVGYCTLYGDMNGGLAVIGDLYKTTVFALCSWLDAPESASCREHFGLATAGALIGEAIRLKPPSAELSPDQKDSDSLPDYAVLDPILSACIEELRSTEELIAAGTDPELAHRVQGLLRKAEFKRRQAPPLLKVSRRAFGTGWRMPIAAAR
ncbi:NAD+ synthase [Cyanobium sp. Morenito 9A2]|uniref:NAD+ synthase n=1 Tax=Cyanobium sp. Morenito 9A2 TaxID=2823718 RepID=UPI0020CCC081|nr:NAD+ synthase [Cyanobium sp. Morenito 9A2]MCP9849132.1 NAD+ synthase [Cyanobium sp. Morenito 9A2]